MIVLMLGIGLPTWAQTGDAGFNQIVELIASGNYEFEGIWAYPQRRAQVDMTTRPNKLAVMGETARAELPYFGRVTGWAGAYSSTGGGINFDGTTTKYEVTKNEKKGKVVVRFRVKEGTESYDCILTVTKSGSANLSVSSNYRQTIRYSGKVKKIE